MRPRPTCEFQLAVDVSAEETNFDAKVAETHCGLHQIWEVESGQHQQAVRRDVFVIQAFQALHHDSCPERTALLNTQCRAQFVNSLFLKGVGLVMKLP